MEILSTLIAVVGGILGFVGWIWITVKAFKNSDILWGVLSIFTLGLCGLIYGFIRFKELKTPTLMMLASIGLAIVNVIIAAVLIGGAVVGVANDMQNGSGDASQEQPGPQPIETGTD